MTHLAGKEARQGSPRHFHSSAARLPEEKAERRRSEENNPPRRKREREREREREGFKSRVPARSDVHLARRARGFIRWYKLISCLAFQAFIDARIRGRQISTADRLTNDIIERDGKHFVDRTALIEPPLANKLRASLRSKRLICTP